jgi:hypothetical protein
MRNRCKYDRKKNVEHRTRSRFYYISCPVVFVDLFFITGLRCLMERTLRKIPAVLNESQLFVYKLEEMRQVWVVVVYVDIWTAIDVIRKLWVIIKNQLISYVEFSIIDKNELNISVRIAVKHVILFLVNNIIEFICTFEIKKEGEEEIT